MFCKYCGKELDENAVVCVNCGSPTDKFKAEMEKKEVVAEHGADSSLNKHNVFGIIGLALAVLSVAFSFWNTTTFFIVLAAGLTLSIIGLVKSKNYKPYGKGLSIAGVSVSGASLVIWIILLSVLII